MKKLIQFTFLIFATIIYAQNVGALDSKNGFRDFKFGSPASSFNKISETENLLNLNNVTLYRYTGDDIKSLYGVPVNYVQLLFYKNQLYSVSINFGSSENSFTEAQYYSLKNYLISLYGEKNYKATNDDGSVVNGTLWAGNKVILELMRIDMSKHKYDPQNYGYAFGYIHIYDQKLDKEMNHNNF